ncbi:MAG: TIGR00730 family Rossman fold protein [Candidatus Zambryskibacteria bacterium]|nr:TIGR00730 family Rossman fold protein [Candidatus Zambryskibacteria bacterium]
MTNENNVFQKSHFKTLTKRELHDTAVERIHLIAKEFTAGFDFLKDYPKSVTIFGSSHITENNPYYWKARSLGGLIIKDLKYSVITGGGPGIMEAVNRGAFEAGGNSLGLTIELSHEQIRNKYLTKNLDFYYFFSRKVCMAFSAEAFVFFPGGLGTLNEFFEIITLVQTGKIERLPIILVGSEFWNKVDNFMKKELLVRELIESEDVNIYTITDDENEILEIIRNAPVTNGVKLTHTN